MTSCYPVTKKGRERQDIPDFKVINLSCPDMLTDLSRLVLPLANLISTSSTPSFDSAMKTQKAPHLGQTSPKLHTDMSMNYILPSCISVTSVRMPSDMT